MCIAFENMIDKAEDVYSVVIVAFCCDNDGGSQRGRKDLVLKRPWLFGPSCCAHQVTDRRSPYSEYQLEYIFCLLTAIFNVVPTHTRRIFYCE